MTAIGTSPTQCSEHPIIFGAPYSVYVRAVRLALEEKGAHYELIPVDIFAPGGPPPERMTRHPFGKIPAFEHAGFRLYEAGAITRYVDGAFPNLGCNRKMLAVAPE
jgi:glutathione S-transferase